MSSWVRKYFFKSINPNLDIVNIFEAQKSLKKNEGIYKPYCKIRGETLQF